MSKNFLCRLYQGGSADLFPAFDIGAKQSPVANYIDQARDAVSHRVYLADHVVREKFFVMAGYGQTVIDVRRYFIFIK